MEFEDKNEQFNFEKYICAAKTRLWVNEAYNLTCCAKELNEAVWQSTQDVFSGKKNVKAYFSGRIERMLWAYAFENVLKAIIIEKIKKEQNISEVPLNKIKGHDLLGLAKVAKSELSEKEKFYFGILHKCSLWGGRYPLPLRACELPQKRKGGTREELFKRSKKDFDDYCAGLISRIECENDVLHSGIGDWELNLYADVFDRLIKEIQE